MAIHSQQVIIGTKPVQIYPADADGVRLLIKSDANIFIGNSDLTIETGYPLSANQALQLELAPMERAYALVASGRATVFVLATMNQ